MRRGWWWSGALALLVGCERIEPSGRPWQAVVPPAAEAVHAAQQPPSGYDFAADERGAEGEPPPDEVADPMALQARLLGVPEERLPERPDSPPVAEPLPVQSASAPALAATEPERPAVVPGTHRGGGWGIRVLAILPHVMPPRAVVALEDGTERVVKAGTLLADQRLVVMAVGRDAVELAEIREGDGYATVETRLVPVLFPSTVPE